jgi:Na+/H+ antiporter NhaD/arsenite permease-like protein
VPLIIGIAISANLQGAATLIGDPPSMMLAGYFKLSFNDFFFHRAGGEGALKPSIFFAIQCGAIFGLAVLWVIVRRHTHKMEPVPVEKPNRHG